MITHFFGFEIATLPGISVPTSSCSRPTHGLGTAFSKPELRLRLGSLVYRARKNRFGVATDSDSRLGTESVTISVSGNQVKRSSEVSMT